MSSVTSIVRGGPSELFRGFLASSLRDAPYAGLFVVFYEAIKYEAASVVPPSTPLVSAALHGGSAAAAGTIATLATHPFDVIKVLSCSFLETMRAYTVSQTRMQVRSEDKYRGLARTVLAVWNVSPSPYCCPGF